MIYFIGDVHAQFRALITKMTLFDIRNSSIVQVGDFGAGFKRDEELELKGIDEFLKGRNSQLYIIRGNHDMPSYFSQTNKKGNIHFLKDYSLLEINNKKLLLIGGAISIDRTHRVEGSSYWKDEAFNFDEKLLTKTLEGIDKVDIVVTHNAPTEFWPYELSPTVQHFLERDKPLFTDLVNERNAHSNLMKQLNRFKPRYWYYGHFHAKYKGEYEGIKYRLLDEMEIYTHITK